MDLIRRLDILVKVAEATFGVGLLCVVEQQLAFFMHVFQSVIVGELQEVGLCASFAEGSSI